MLKYYIPYLTYNVEHIPNTSQVDRMCGGGGVVVVKRRVPFSSTKHAMS